jgi:hypothetical protein
MAFRCDRFNRFDALRVVARAGFEIVSSARRNGFVPYRHVSVDAMRVVELGLKAKGK